MSSDRLQRVAAWASIVAAGAMVGTLLFGVWNYSRTADAEVQLSALSALQHHLDLAVQHPDLAGRDKDHPVDLQYGWFAAHALTTAQTLWILVGRQADWRRAVNAIIRQHRSYLRSGAFVCMDFTPEFVSYVRGQVRDFKCAVESQ